MTRHPCPQQQSYSRTFHYHHFISGYDVITTITSHKVKKYIYTKSESALVFLFCTAVLSALNSPSDSVFANSQSNISNISKCNKKAKTEDMFGCANTNFLALYLQYCLYGFKTILWCLTREWTAFLLLLFKPFLWLFCVLHCTFIVLKQSFYNNFLSQPLNQAGFLSQLLHFFCLIKKEKKRQLFLKHCNVHNK